MGCNGLFWALLGCTWLYWMWLMLLRGLRGLSGLTGLMWLKWVIWLIWCLYWRYTFWSLCCLRCWAVYLMWRCILLQKSIVCIVGLVQPRRIPARWTETHRLYKDLYVLYFICFFLSYFACVCLFSSVKYSCFVLSLPDGQTHRIYVHCTRTFLFFTGCFPRDFQHHNQKRVAVNKRFSQC